MNIATFYDLTIHEMSNTPFSHLPQDVLLEVSQYGNVAPSLDPVYIRDIVSSLDPNFRWDSELVIEYLKNNNPFYGIISGKYPRFRGEIGRLNDKHIITITGDPSLASQFLDNLGLEYSINDNSITAYVPDDMDNMSHEAERLMDIRPIPSSKLGQYYSIRDDRITKAGETYHLDVPDEDIIRSIIRFNPKYDMGSLLAWLRLKQRVCQEISLDPILSEMNDLFQNNITRVGSRYWHHIGPPHLHTSYCYDDLQVYLSKNANMDRVLNYLTARGVQGLMIHPNEKSDRVPERYVASGYEGDKNEIIRRIILDFTMARTCRLQYNPGQYLE